MHNEMTEEEKQYLNRAADAKILADREGQAEIQAELERTAEMEAEREAKWNELISVPHAMVDGVPVPLTQEEIEALEIERAEARENRRIKKIEEIRQERNHRLSETDWTQLNDNGLSDEKKLAWRNYRQNLRDLMEGLDDPEAVVWPSKPD